MTTSTLEALDTVIELMASKFDVKFLGHY
jgi:hypothetical protein